jgi:hypothetical protein
MSDDVVHARAACFRKPLIQKRGWIRIARDDIVVYLSVYFICSDTRLVSVSPGNYGDER